MFRLSLEILSKIESFGFKAYIVGGYPRDIYLNRDSLDIDICTNATPQDLKKIFNNLKLSASEYGSVTLIENNIIFEITTFRKDIKYVDNRRPVKIEYIQNLSDDLKRRDFTINTLCIDSNGTTIDLLNSKKDLNKKLLKTIINPDISLNQDILRSLRAIRFATTLNFKIDNELKKSIIKYKNLLNNLSYNRKKEELNKIFSSTNCLYGIDLIKELKLDKVLKLNNINNIIYTSSSIGIWSQLDVLDIYPFTKQDHIDLIKLNELKTKNVLDKKVIYKYGLYLCCLAAEIKGIDRKDVNIVFNDLKIKNIKEIDITGIEICKILNRKPGYFIKMIYSKLEEEIINNNLDNNNIGIKKYIEKTYL